MSNKRIHFHNQQPGEPITPGVAVDAVKREFAARLQRALVDKGWNQSELARRAQVHMEGGGEFSRDLVSKYIRGLVLPQPQNLKPMCQALGLQPEDLLPSRGVPSSASRNPPLEMRQMEDGLAWIRVNQAVPMPVAMKVLALLADTGSH